MQHEGVHDMEEYTWAFLSCHADVRNYEMELKTTPQSTSLQQSTTTAQSVSPYQITSSSHAVTTLFSSRTSTIITTPLSQRTSMFTAIQTTNHHLETTASAPKMTTEETENSTLPTGQTTHEILSSTAAGEKSTGKPPLPTNKTTTAQACKKTTIQRTEKTTRPTNQTTYSRTTTTATSKTTTAKPTSPTNQTTTLAEIITATTTIAGKTTTQPINRTTHIAAKTTVRRTNTSTINPGTQPTVPLVTTNMVPIPIPDPSSPATGVYNVSIGNMSCIKASMGLELSAQNSKMEWTHFNIDPSITRASGSCGEQQSNLNLTFNGGFINFTFVKKGTIYYVSRVEASLTITSAGAWHNVTNKQLFTAQMGNSFKCVSKQTVKLADNFHLLTMNTQLQAFAIVNNQFGKEEECSLDRNRRTIPIALGLSTLGLFVFVLILGLISRRKPSRGYEHI
ncbi:lysosome-associated membrane glycoprotein 3 [Carettochelys insculpta]|uniref:lysosome-associated membrane glycoprotein 3 n=1 Tax=Carettochelys insculpta TaxID=44489 RepID=UPI003EB896B9